MSFGMQAAIAADRLDGIVQGGYQKIMELRQAIGLSGKMDPGQYVGPEGKLWVME